MAVVCGAALWFGEGKPVDRYRAAESGSSATRNREPINSERKVPDMSTSDDLRGFARAQYTG